MLERAIEILSLVRICSQQSHLFVGLLNENEVSIRHKLKCPIKVVYRLSQPIFPYSSQTALAFLIKESPNVISCRLPLSWQLTPQAANSILWYILIGTRRSGRTLAYVGPWPAPCMKLEMHLPRSQPWGSLLSSWSPRDSMNPAVYVS